MISFRSVVQKVAPKLAAIKQFSQKVYHQADDDTRTSTTANNNNNNTTTDNTDNNTTTDNTTNNNNDNNYSNIINNNNKKVKFDLATVSFQVNYDNGVPAHPHDHYSSSNDARIHDGDADTDNVANSKMHKHHRRSDHKVNVMPSQQPNATYPTRSTPPAEPGIPLWKEHLVQNQNRKTKSNNNSITNFRKITCAQWIQLCCALFCAIQAIIQVYQTWLLYRKGYTLSSVNHRLPSEIRFPALTLCLPAIMPYQESQIGRKCRKRNLPQDEDYDLSSDDERRRDLDGDEPNQSASPSDCTEKTNSIAIWRLFNQSISEYGHQCRIRFRRAPSTYTSASSSSSSSSFKVSNCASVTAPIESYFRNKRCYTYLSEMTNMRSNDNNEKQRQQHQDIPLSSILDHSDVYISLTIQSNRIAVENGGSANQHNSRRADGPVLALPQLFIHSPDKIPIDSIRSPVTLRLDHRYTFEYYYVRNIRRLKQRSFFRCHDYGGRANLANEQISTANMPPPLSSSPSSSSFSSSSSLPNLEQVASISRQDCLDRCFLREQRSEREQLDCPAQRDCVSHQIPLRRDLVRLREDKICYDAAARRQCAHLDEDALIQSVLDRCDRHCPDDCSTIDVVHETKHLDYDTLLPIDDSEPTASGDGSIQAIIKRKITPDIEIVQYPMMSKRKLCAQIGGLAFFWFAIGFVVLRLVRALQLATHFVQAYLL